MGEKWVLWPHFRFIWKAVVSVKMQVKQKDTQYDTIYIKFKIYYVVYRYICNKLYTCGKDTQLLKCNYLWTGRNQMEVAQLYLQYFSS